MAISSATTTAAVTALGTKTSTRVQGTVNIGATATTQFASADIAYCLTANFATVGNELTLNVQAGTATGTTRIAGSAQVETATVVAASGCSEAGTCSLALTSGVVTGASVSLAIAVPLTLTENTAAKVATALAAGLNANVAFAAQYAATTATADVLITRKTDVHGYFYATDASLNLAIPAGLGISAAATSTGTNAGTITSGVLVTDGDGLDFEGTAITTIEVLYGLHIAVTHGDASTDSAASLPCMFYSPNGSTGALLTDDLVIEAVEAGTQVVITVIGYSVAPS
mgnify:CR=1 FL=1